MKKKRLKFSCWDCKREYEMTRELDDKPTLFVACPFCEKEAVVDLAPYRTKETTVYRGPGKMTGPEVEGFNFPAVIPTAAPKTS